jgi:AraC-like DNA-binding protein
MVEVEPVGAEAAHLLVALGHEPIAFDAEDLEIARRHSAIEDEEPVAREAAGVVGRESGGRRCHIALLAGHGRSISRGDVAVYSSFADVISSLAMRDDLGLRSGVEGRVARHVAADGPPRAHRHAELELDLVVRGSATYLLGERRYELTPGTLTWLFPGQDHVLVDESRDHELWWAVFSPALVARTAATPTLRQPDPAGDFSRRLPARRAGRLDGLLREIRDADGVDDALLNAGLAYLLVVAWRAFVDSEERVAGADVHPAVETVARRLQLDPEAGNLDALAAAAGLSAAHLSRLFKAQTGVSITRFRNQRRLERFRTLYGDGRHTTTLAAALQAGFGSYAQFFRVFRAETGGNPTGRSRG